MAVVASEVYGVAVFAAVKAGFFAAAFAVVAASVVVGGAVRVRGVFDGASVAARAFASFEQMGVVAAVSAQRAVVWFVAPLDVVGRGRVAA